MSRVVRQIPPAKALINGIRAIGYSFSTSVADIIDNSIDAKATKIDIYSDPQVEDPYFAFLDNGKGMTYEELNNAMIFGSDRSNKIDNQLDLGRFGLGLKSASLSQCRELIVISKVNNAINAMSYNLDVIERDNDWNLIILENDEMEKIPMYEKLLSYDSGTLVIWRKFDKLENLAKDFNDTFRSVVTDSKKHVELVFHRFYDKVEINYNNSRIEKRDPFLISSVPRTQIGRVNEIPMDGAYISVTPYVLPYANTITNEEKKLLGNPKSIYDEQGFYIYRNDRLIISGNWLRMNVRSENAKLARVSVDIPSSLDSQWSIDVKKSTAKIPDKVKEQIRASIDDSITRSKRVNRYKGTKEQEVENKIWNRIDLRDGKVEYKINSDNPLLKEIKKNMDSSTLELFEQFLIQLENFIPKYSIKNDSIDDEITIVNDDNLEEKIKVENLIKFLQNYPQDSRGELLKNLLNSEGFSRLKDKYDEILEVVSKL